jgi:hypothetical protein
MVFCNNGGAAPLRRKSAARNEETRLAMSRRGIDAEFLGCGALRLAKLKCAAHFHLASPRGENDIWFPREAGLIDIGE